MKVFGFLFYILVVVQYISCAGIAVHFFIANQVAELNQFTDPSYFVGSFFPDAFYNCFDHSQTAENIHWPPFTSVAVKYYRDQYVSQGISNKKLKHFIFGLFTHQVADVSWHSLNSDQGLIRMIAEIEFDGDYRSAHNFVDTAGDLILLDSLFQNLSEEKTNKLLQFYSMRWTYPIADIMAILNLSGYERISKTELEICLNRGVIALKSELGAVIASRKAKRKHNFSLERSPLFSESLYSYYYGGINQIINTLQICKIELADWFKGFISKEPWDICHPIFKKHDTKIGVKGNQSDYINDIVSELKMSNSDDDEVRYISPMVRGSQFGFSMSFGYYLGEPTLAVGAPFEDNLGAVYMIPINEIIGNSAQANTNLKSNKILFKNISTLTYPVLFGSKLVNWKIGEYDFLVISEPGKSIFKIFLDNRLVATLNLLSSDNIMGSKGVKQFDIISNKPIDYDKDGSSDFIIGSPYTDYLSSPQTGRFFIVKGYLFNNAMDEHFKRGFDTPLHLNLEEFISHKFNLPLSLFQQNGYDHFADSVAFTDDYVLASVGSLGSIATFVRDSSKFIGILNENGLEENHFFNRIISQESKLFGFNFIITGKCGEIEWVIVSKSADSYDDCNICGSVILFKIEKGIFQKIGVIKPLDTNNTLSSNKSDYMFGRFGSNGIKINDNIVIISSPGYGDGRGALYLLNIGNIIYQKLNGNDVHCEMFHIGDEGVGFSNFGASLEIFIHFNKMFLAIGMPSYGIGSVKDFSSSLSGYVKVVEVGKVD